MSRRIFRQHLCKDTFYLMDLGRAQLTIARASKNAPLPVMTKKAFMKINYCSWLISNVVIKKVSKERIFLHSFERTGTV